MTGRHKAMVQRERDNNKGRYAFCLPFNHELNLKCYNSHWGDIITYREHQNFNLSPVKVCFLFSSATMFRPAASRFQICGRILGRRNASTNVAIQNLESRWKTLSTAEQNTIAKQLEEAQKGDWKLLSLEEKKAACEFLFWSNDDVPVINF